MGLVFLAIFTAQLSTVGAVHASLDIGGEKFSWSMPDVSNVTHALEGFIQTASSQLKLLRHETPKNGTEESALEKEEEGFEKKHSKGPAKTDTTTHLPNIDDQLKIDTQNILNELKASAPHDVDKDIAKKIAAEMDRPKAKTKSTTIDSIGKPTATAIPSDVKKTETAKTKAAPAESSKKTKQTAATKKASAAPETPAKPATAAQMRRVTPIASPQTQAGAAHTAGSNVESRLEALEEGMKQADHRASEAEHREHYAEEEVSDLKKALAAATNALSHEVDTDIKVAPKGWKPRNTVIPIAVPKAKNAAAAPETQAHLYMGEDQTPPSNPPLPPSKSKSTPPLPADEKFVAELTGADPNAHFTGTPAPTPSPRTPQEYLGGGKTAKTSGEVHNPDGTWGMGKTIYGSPNDWGAWTWTRSPDGDYQLVWIKANNFHKWMWMWPGRFSWSGPHRRRGTWKRVDPTDWAEGKHDLVSHMWEQGPPPHHFNPGAPDGKWSDGMVLPGKMGRMMGVQDTWYSTPAPRAMPTAAPEGWIHTTPKPGNGYVDNGRAAADASGTPPPYGTVNPWGGNYGGR